MRQTLSFLILLQFLILNPALSASYAFDLPDEAFQDLAGAVEDPCSICAQKKVKKACAVLDKAFIPGTVLRTDENCRLLKTGKEDGNNLELTCYPSKRLVNSLQEGDILPRLVFAFYTDENKLVGISGKDYTDKATSELFRLSRPGTIFEGELKLIPYAYGNGPSYNYFPQTNKLQVHCVIVKLTPVTGK